MAAFLLTGGNDLHVTASILSVPYIVLFLAYWRPVGASSQEAHAARRRLIPHVHRRLSGPVIRRGGLDRHGSGHLNVRFGLAITYAVAFASWRVVERPALRLKLRREDDAGQTPAVG